MRVVRFPSATGLGNIYAEVWAPEQEPWAVLQIAHGMAEHIGRYAQFAEYLMKKGVVVAMHDHAGHGKSIEEANHKGYFGLQNGKTALLQDMKYLRDYVAALYPEVPYVMMGHSMGSFLARAYAAFYTGDLAACIFSGTGGKNPLLPVGRAVAKFEFWRSGPRKPSKLLHTLSFGSFNKSVKNARTSSDWLSRDANVVSKYEEDPLCGFYFTAEAMSDLFGVMRGVNGTRWAKKVPSIPILIFSGSRDPVGGFGKGVMQVYGWLQRTGHTVTLVLYPEGRHEMLNELNYQEVYRDVLSFLEKYFKP